MELVKALNHEVFLDLEEAFCGPEGGLGPGRTTPIRLDDFIDTIRTVAAEHGVSTADPDAIVAEAALVAELSRQQEEGGIPRRTSSTLSPRKPSTGPSPFALAQQNSSAFHASAISTVPTKALSIRSLMQLFHQIDYRDRKVITWEEFTMFLIDDAKSGKRRTDGTEQGRMDRFQETFAVKQDPVGRVRGLRYVPGWDSLIRLTGFNGEYCVEMVKPKPSRTRGFETKKISPVQNAPITAVEVIPELNTIATANSDVSMNFYHVPTSLEEAPKRQLELQRRVDRTELRESHVAMLWHPHNKRLLTGTRSGMIVPWELRMERATPAERYKPLNDFAWRYSGAKRHPISSIIPWDDKCIVGTMASQRNIAILDIEAQVKSTLAGDSIIEEWKPDEVKDGHRMGVLALTRNDWSQMVVSAGFERVPFVWVLKLPNFQPWKLLDKQEPHRADITTLLSPPNTPQVISADNRGMIKIWDIRTFHCVQTITADRKQRVGGGHAASEAEEKQFYCSVTYDSGSGSIVATGPRTTFCYRGDVPKYQSSVDDSPVVACCHNGAARSFITAHHTSVKIWEENSGSIISAFEDITPEPITALSLDHRGRKFFVGDKRGTIQGHVYATGIAYRKFMPLNGPVASLSYTVFRSGKRFLLACGGEEFTAFDDSEVDGKQSRITQPLHLMRAHLSSIDSQQPTDSHGVQGLIAASPAPAPPRRGMSQASEASPNSRAASFTRNRSLARTASVVSISAHLEGLDESNAKLQREQSNMTFLKSVREAASTRASIAVSQQPEKHRKFAFTQVVSQSKLSVAFLVSQSLLAAVDIGTMTVIHLFAVEENISCVTPLGDLPAIAILDCKYQLYVFAIRPSLSAEKLLVATQLLDEGQLMMDPADRAAPSAMTFHQNKRRLYVGDSAGTVRVWNVAELVKACGLSPAAYPMTSIAETILRKRHSLPDPDAAASMVTLERRCDAHADEITTIDVVFTNNAVAIVTASYDHTVRVWDWEFNDLGQLSQGRFVDPENAVDPEAVSEHYSRNNIKPFRFVDATAQDDEIHLSDFSDLVLRLLRRCIHRYRARKVRQRRRTLRALGLPVPAMTDSANPTPPAVLQPVPPPTKMSPSPVSPAPGSPAEEASLGDTYRGLSTSRSPKKSSTRRRNRKAMFVDENAESPAPVAMTPGFGDSVSPPPTISPAFGESQESEIFASVAVDEEAEEATPAAMMQERRKSTNIRESGKSWDVLTRVDVGERRVHVTTAGSATVQTRDPKSESSVGDTSMRGSRQLVPKLKGSMRVGTVASKSSFKTDMSGSTNGTNSGGNFSFLDGSSVTTVQSYATFGFGAPMNQPSPAHSARLEAMSHRPKDGTAPGNRRSLVRREKKDFDKDGLDGRFHHLKALHGQDAKRIDVPVTERTLYHEKIAEEKRRERHVAEKCSVNQRSMEAMHQAIKVFEERADPMDAIAEVVQPEIQMQMRHRDGGIPALPDIPRINLDRMQMPKTMNEEADQAARRLFDSRQESLARNMPPAPQSARPLMPSRMEALLAPSTDLGVSLPTLTTSKRGNHQHPRAKGLPMTARTLPSEHRPVAAVKSTGYSSSVYNTSNTMTYWA